MSFAIKVENVSKAYRLGEIGTGTLSNDLKRWYARTRGKEDPFLKIGEINDRTVKGTSDVVWSLKDINFEIQQGEAVGIIGRNGAGKSTLLKILSRVTGPTTGKITGNGRVASLLEVGTGFHPELTGKDNIYLNGAILGMRKKEIKRKFDAIVDFAGVERYIDTPVKRYSSGMYVRLAFAVAAYLESEILIVDEVLAVGDAEFQKKCLGKMNEVSRGEGRTVLFVSHNMDAISRLCAKTLILENGRLSFDGETESAIKLYLSNQKALIRNSFQPKTGKDIYFKNINVASPNRDIVYFGDSLNIEIQIFSKQVVQNLECSFQIFDIAGEAITYNWITTSIELKDIIGKRGEFLITIHLPCLRLYKGEYYFTFYLADPRGKIIHDIASEVFGFEVVMGNMINEFGWRNGVCRYIENYTTTVNIRSAHQIP